MTPRPPRPTLFPYTTLFRSSSATPASEFAPAPAAIGPTCPCRTPKPRSSRSEEHTSELQSRVDLVCRLLLEKKNRQKRNFSQTITVGSYKSIYHLSKRVPAL